MEYLNFRICSFAHHTLIKNFLLLNSLRLRFFLFLMKIPKRSLHIQTTYHMQSFPLIFHGYIDIPTIIFLQDKRIWPKLCWVSILTRVCSRDFPGRGFPGIPGFFRDFSREEKFDGISREFPGNSRDILAFPVSRFPGNEKSGKLQTLLMYHFDGPLVSCI